MRASAVTFCALEGYLSFSLQLFLKKSLRNTHDFTGTHQTQKNGSELRTKDKASVAKNCAGGYFYAPFWHRTVRDCAASHCERTISVILLRCRTVFIFMNYHHGYVWLYFLGYVSASSSSKRGCERKRLFRVCQRQLCSKQGCEWEGQTRLGKTN